MFKPFALELYERHLAGDTVQKLSLELGISIERIEWRIKAATAYLERQKGASTDCCIPVRGYVRHTLDLAAVAASE